MKLLRRGLWVLAALLLLVVLLGLWLLFSASGAGVAFSIINRSVPGLEITDIGGSLGTGLTIRQVRYRQPAREIVLDNITLTGRLAALNRESGSLDVAIERATLTDLVHPRTATRLEWPTLPSLPLTLNPLRVTVNSFRWIDAQGAQQLSARLKTHGRIGAGGIELDSLQITGPQLNASGQLSLRGGQLRPTGKLTISGEWAGRPIDADFSATIASHYGVIVNTRAPLLSTLTLNFGANDALDGEWLLPRQSFDGQTVSAKLVFAGSTTQPSISGRLRWGANRVRNLQLGLKIQPENISITALSGALADSIDQLSASGTLRFNPQPQLLLSGDLQPSPALSAALDALPSPLRVAFELDATAQAAKLNAKLAAAQLAADMYWTPDVINFTLQQQDRLRAEGSVREGVLAAQLALERFNPATVLSDWPGEISGALRINAPDVIKREGIEIALIGLKGQLRNRELGANGTLRFDAQPEPSGAVELTLGNNVIRYTGPTASKHAQADLQLPELAALLPGLRGSLRGVISEHDAVLSLALEATAAGYGSTDAASATLNGTLALRTPERSALTLSAKDLVVANQTLPRTTLTLNGNRETHEIDLQAQLTNALVTLRATGGVSKTSANYEIQALSITPKDHPEWRIAGAASVQLSNKQYALQNLCLTQAQARLCLATDLDAALNGNASAQLNDVDLGQLTSALGLSQEVAVRGTVNGDASANLALGRISALSARLSVPAITAYLVREDREIELKELLVTAQGNTEQLTVQMRSLPDAATFVDGEIVLLSPLASAEEQRFTGRVKFGSTAILPWLLSSDEIRGVRGAINADLLIGGSRAAPIVSGSLTLDKFGLRIPAYGTALSRVELHANLGAIDQITLSGKGQLGAGAVEIGGDLSLIPFGMRLKVSGRNLTLVSTSSIKLSGSPDLSVALEDGLWQITGRVDIPTGQILLDQFDDALRASEDQEFTDVDPTIKTAAIPLLTDIDLTLGPSVALSGAGLTGKLSGSVKLRVKPGEVPSGDGALTVDGRYLAFGRKLDIETARLRFADSPLANPFLDINASRRAGNVKAGVRVRGTAAAPDIRVYTDPTSTQSDALSYLVLGRPLSQSRAGDQAQLSGAAKNLGGGLLAQELGARFGLDAVSLEDAAGFDGPRLMLGKYLSPRLYVAYGISQFDASTLFRVRYLINSRFDVEAERGEELRATINYRRDK